MTDILVQLGHLAGATRFRRISEKLYVDGDKIYQEAGIDFKASWFSVFYVLAQAEAPLTIMTIAQHIDFSHISVKNVLRQLEAENLVRISPNPEDKRSKIAFLSLKGTQLLKQLEPLWVAFSSALKSVYDAGHPDLLSILNRIDGAIERYPITQRVQHPLREPVEIFDYRPSLKHYFYELAGNWLLEFLGGELEEEDKFTLHNPDKAYLAAGGFLFFAQYQSKIVGCVALKRLDENTFEFAKLFIDPAARNLGIATKLIERCITRCRENKATQLWLQTNMAMPEAHKLYDKLGFQDRRCPPQMTTLGRTQKIMCMDL